MKWEGIFGSQFKCIGRDFDLESLFLIASHLLIEKPDWGRETNQSANAWENMKMYVPGNKSILEFAFFVTWGKKAQSKALVENFDLSFCRQDFHHKLEFGNVEESGNEECEDDGNVGRRSHCTEKQVST